MQEHLKKWCSKLWAPRTKLIMPKPSLTDVYSTFFFFKLLWILELGSWPHYFISSCAFNLQKKKNKVQSFSQHEAPCNKYIVFSSGPMTTRWDLFLYFPNLDQLTRCLHWAWFSSARLSTLLIGSLLFTILLLEIYTTLCNWIFGMQ